ncbi:MAG TPA: lysylphosphatidylglycerol synthase transmembrane domain-containing protein [Anaeromyxobacteraceae bacterium]|nr:lysylphosphatidylglycerol synthase transmembrane domain-containing protein [Anaeromyxobacteraceae bacterium]
MKRLLQTLAGLGVSGLALWLTLRGKDLGAIWAEMKVADYRYLLPYLLVLTGIHLAKTVRWGILLEPVARLPFAKLNAASAVGFMALVLLPFRLGEFARPYLVAERPKLRVSSALSSVVVERVADGIFTGILMVVALLAVPDDVAGVKVLRAGGVMVSGAFVAALAFLVVAYRNRALAVRVTGKVLGPFSPRLAARASGMMDAFIHGLRLVPSRRKTALFFLLTCVYWGLNAWGLAILGRGFGFDLSFVQACAVLGMLVVGVMIPAGPGMVGTFQGAILIGLGLFAGSDVVHTRGMAYANVVWAAQIGQTVLFGTVCLFSNHIRLNALFAASDEVSEELQEEEEGYRAEEGRVGPEARGPRR